LRPGTIFWWKNFPYPRFGSEIKPRWFVCLGDTGRITEPTIVFFSTTTTVKDDFEPGGKRAGHHFFRFDKKRYPCFEEDCILDFDEPPYNESEKVITSHKDIEFKGELDKKTLKSIYEGIFRSQYYSPKVLGDIHRSLNQIGITGLQKP